MNKLARKLIAEIEDYLAFFAIAGPRPVHTGRRALTDQAIEDYVVYWSFQ